MTSPLFVVVMGIGTVFFGLICIIILTDIMSRVLKSKGEPASAVKAAPTPAAPAAPDYAPVVAAISAALSEELGPNVKGLTITSIKQI